MGGVLVLCGCGSWRGRGAVRRGVPLPRSPRFGARIHESHFARCVVAVGRWLGQGRGDICKDPGQRG